MYIKDLELEHEFHNNNQVSYHGSVLFYTGNSSQINKTLINFYENKTWDNLNPYIHLINDLENHLNNFKLKNEIDLFHGLRFVPKIGLLTIPTFLSTTTLFDVASSYSKVGDEHHVLKINNIINISGGSVKKYSHKYYENEVLINRNMSLEVYHCQKKNNIFVWSSRFIHQ